ncbi:AAA family ATPase [Methylovirgula sp. 4M-Z18]|uniref:AAA family ATPase n=1 Tax=Methylovirgula sp. 4M-Z18 TaxID=2293567 RepID=UPI0013146463|nr:AAA family ATPase [Methylovirgula sp. 4M-Z18]
MPDAIAALLPILNKQLAPLEDQIHHPSQLLDMPEFQAVVAAFRRPDATFDLLCQHALGPNWMFACAAFIVLSDHSGRQSIAARVLQHIEVTRPFTLPYALRYLTSLEHRPAVGASIIGAPPWWQNNVVIPGFVQDYFARSAALGDTASFGDALGRRPDFTAEPLTGLLQKVQHPFATQLLDQLRAWKDTRIDSQYLSTVGALWEPDGVDSLIVVPPAWDELLKTAEIAIHQSRPRSILVTGDPGTGKTALLKLLAAQLSASGWTVFSASANELMADQMYIGQLEGRIRKLVDALHSRRKLVWYVNDLGQLADSGTHQGQSASILDQILPDIIAGHLIVVGEAGQKAATRLFHARPSLRSIMEVLSLQPMSEDETRSLAGDVGQRISKYTGVAVSEGAIQATMELVQHFLGSRQLPGAVMELLKRSAASVVSSGETELTAASVIATLSQISGLPRVILDTSQKVELSRIRDFFLQRVIGQDEAVNAVVDRIAMLKAGLTDPARPIGVFLFAGPTGTGKTELAKTTAEFLFGSSDRMTRLDMSEFQTAEATSKILGQRGDYMSDSLIDRTRRQPFSVILLDEFEKAHSNCWDLFLQIFDDGRLTDANGREADFRHCLIILTSNLGATAHHGGGFGFRPAASTYAGEQVHRTIAQTFRPEFVNRLDKIIVFQPLSRDLMRSILRKELALVQERRGLRTRAWAVEWEASAIEFLLDRGFSPEMGARPLKRAIDQLLLAPLAATLVEHRFPQGDQFLFVRSDGTKIEVEFVDPAAGAVKEPEVELAVENDLSLPAIVLRQSGSGSERATLTNTWREIQDRFASDAWREAADQLQQALTDPDIWQRPDRHRIFESYETIDRLGEAARTAARLFERYQATSRQSARAARELAARFALQLYNLRQGLDDVEQSAPIDVLLRVEPTLDSGGDAANTVAWCQKVTDMYRQWARKRRMQIKEIAQRNGKAMPILHITGFGAYRALETEAGLHVLDDPTQENGRRTVAHVAVAPGPKDPVAESDLFDASVRLLAIAPSTTTIVRRYREGGSPIVRDSIKGWRTGRLDMVLGGDFDLIGARSETS